MSIYTGLFNTLFYIIYTVASNASEGIHSDRQKFFSLYDGLLIRRAVFKSCGCKREWKIATEKRNRKILDICISEDSGSDEDDSEIENSDNSTDYDSPGH